MQSMSLKVFEVLLECGSFRRAAARLGTTPAEIARHIDALEKQCGQPLLERRPKSIKLTPAGERLRQQGLSAGPPEQADSPAGGPGDPEAGTLNLRTVGMAVDDVVVPVVAEFANLYPQISISIAISGAPETVDAVRSRQADFAISVTFEPGRGRPPHDSRRDLAAVFAPFHPLAARQTVTLAEVVQHGLMLPDSSYILRDVIEARIREAGLPIRPRFTLNSVHMLKELAVYGSGVLLMPRMAVEREHNLRSLVSRPVEGLDIHAAYHLIEPDDRKPTAAMKEFRKLVIAYIRKTSGQKPDFIRVATSA